MVLANYCNNITGPLSKPLQTTQVEMFCWCYYCYLIILKWLHRSSKVNLWHLPWSWPNAETSKMLITLLWCMGSWSSQPHFKLAQDTPDVSHQVPPSFRYKSKQHLRNLTLWILLELHYSFLTVIQTLDQVQVRGTFKLWILRCYLVPFFYFSLAVDPNLEMAIKNASCCSQDVQMMVEPPSS